MQGFRARLILLKQIKVELKLEDILHSIYVVYNHIRV